VPISERILQVTRDFLRDLANFRDMVSWRLRRPFFLCRLTGGGPAALL
jgi:hypothetical protein